jgi:hypothetical protein
MEVSVFRRAGRYGCGGNHLIGMNRALAGAPSAFAFSIAASICSSVMGMHSLVIAQITWGLFPRGPITLIAPLLKIGFSAVR